VRPRAAWLEAREEGRARRAVLLPLAGAARLYAVGAALHRSLYRARWLRARRFPGRVVSVGNLTVGGNAKTPAAAWLARSLASRGHQVVLASRGAGARPGPDVVVVSDGRFVRSRAEEAGDEALVLAAHAPGVPVLVARDRGRAALRALSAFGADLVVLDDGFQHHRLARDVDLLLVDAAQGFGNGRVLPRGPLREPLSALQYAHAVGFVDGEPGPREQAALARFAPLARIFRARRRPVSLRPLAGGPGAPPESLAGAEVGMLAGLARPASLRATLERLGARVVAERRFPDHHRYRARDLRGLAELVPRWITSEKDAFKLSPDWLGGADLQVLEIELEVEQAPDFLDWLEARLR